jgi:hypothetical protein
MKFKDTKLAYAMKNISNKAKIGALAAFTAFKVLTADIAVAQVQNAFASRQEIKQEIISPNYSIENFKSNNAGVVGNAKEERNEIRSLTAGGHLGFMQSSTDFGIQNLSDLGLNLGWNISPSALLEASYSTLWKGSENARLPAGKDTVAASVPRSQIEVSFAYMPYESPTGNLGGKIALYGANNPHLAGIDSRASNYGWRIMLDAYTNYLGPVGVGATVEGGTEWKGGRISHDVLVTPRIGVAILGEEVGFFNRGRLAAGTKIAVRHGTTYDTYGYFVPYNTRLFYTIRASAQFWNKLNAIADAEFGTNHISGKFELGSQVDGREVKLGVQYAKEQTEINSLKIDCLRFTFSMTTGQ